MKSSVYGVASIILIDANGNFLLQQRDEKPGILNPGMLTLWGGALEGAETPAEGALREIVEETNLRPSVEDLEYVGAYERDYTIADRQVVNYVFVLRNVDPTKLQIFEGQGYVVVDPTVDVENPKYSDFTNIIIGDYAKFLH